MCWKLKEQALDRTVWRTGFVKADYVMKEKLGVHSNTYFYVLLVKHLYRPERVYVFPKIIGIKSSYFRTQQQTVGACTGRTASILYATGSKLFLRHLQTTKEAPHVVVISLGLSVTYISA